MIGSIGKQSGESVGKEKRKTAVGRICCTSPIMTDAIISTVSGVATNVNWGAALPCPFLSFPSPPPFNGSPGV